MHERGRHQPDAISVDDGELQEPPNLDDHLSTRTPMAVHTIREIVRVDRVDSRSSEEFDGVKTVSSDDKDREADDFLQGRSSHTQNGITGEDEISGLLAASITPQHEVVTC